MTRTFIAAAAFATFALTGAAPAATTTATVQIDDLNLATAQGQDKLESRLNRATRQVCGETMTGSRIPVIDSACVARARAMVEKQVAERRSSSRNGG